MEDENEKKPTKSQLWLLIDGRVDSGSISGALGRKIGIHYLSSLLKQPCASWNE